MWPRYT